MDYVFSKAQAEARVILAKAADMAQHELPLFSEPKDFALGNISSSVCFQISKQRKSAPDKLAKEIAAKLHTLPEGSYFKKAEDLKGYINFHYSDKFYAESLTEIRAENEKYGSSESGNGKTIVLEYSQPNVGKPMHFGHIRSTIIGDSFKKVYAFLGWKTVSINYLGDSGLQVAKLVLATEVFKDMPEPENEKIMLDYYVKIHKKIEEEPELEEKAKDILAKIEAGDEATLKKVKFLREKSYQAFQRNYDLLGVKFDEVTGESAFIDESKKVVAEAEKKGLAKKEETGETIALLEPTLPNTVILRSNGTTLYSTRDLSLADYKQAKYNFDASVVFTASEQNLYFKQVIRLLKLLGRPYADSYKHAGFGLIELPQGRMSTRKGQVIFLEDVLTEAVQYALKEVQEKQDYTPDAQREIAHKVGIAALKYAVLKIQLEKNIVFDPQAAVKFEGNTAAYLQYTAVRAKHILRKAATPSDRIKPSQIAKEKASKFALEKRPAEKAATGKTPFGNEERKLIAVLSIFPLEVEASARSLVLNNLCNYLYKLATQFSSFYDACPVLTAENEEKKQLRLQIVRSTLTTLENGLRLLGMEVPEKM